MVGEIFQIYGVQITGKCICESTMLNLNIFTHASFGKILPQVLINISQAEGNHLPPRQHFFPKSVDYEKLFLLLRYSKFCLDFFDYLGKLLGKKAKVNFKIDEITVWTANNYNTRYLISQEVKATNQ